MREYEDRDVRDQLKLQRIVEYAEARAAAGNMCSTTSAGTTACRKLVVTATIAGRVTSETFSTKSRDLPRPAL